MEEEEEGWGEWEERRGDVVCGVWVPDTPPVIEKEGGWGDGGRG